MRMPGVTWIGPTVNCDRGRMGPVRGLCLHIQQGTEAGSEAWLKNAKSQASAHFLNPKNGDLRQLVDTADKAWAQAAGNSNWISIENEGKSGEALTPLQIEHCAELLVWLHHTYAVPLNATDNPNGSGLGWHGMGGAAWGGHLDCPGEPIKAQRPQIIAYADRLIPPTPVNYQEADDMVIVFHNPDGSTAVAAVPGCGLVGVSSVAQAEAMYPGYHDAKPTPAEWADIMANYKAQKK